MAHHGEREGTRSKTDPRDRAEFREKVTECCRGLEKDENRPHSAVCTDVVLTRLLAVTFRGIISVEWWGGNHIAVGWRRSREGGQRLKTDSHLPELSRGGRRTVGHGWGRGRVFI